MMKPAFHLAALLAAPMLLAAPASASAQKFHEAPQARSRTIAFKMAQCVVKTLPQAVVETLNAPFGDAETARRFVAIAPSGCLDVAIRPAIAMGPNQLRQPVLLTRGFLYQVLFARDFGKSDPTVSFADLAPITYPVAVTPGAGTAAHDYRILMRIGDCTVRHDPAGARDLISSTIASKTETAAIAALDPAWSACLAPGSKAVFTPDVIRGAVAEPLYRLSLARAGGAAAVKEEPK